MTIESKKLQEERPIIYPETVLPLGENLIAGFQHVIAMFGSTALAPILMGFDPNVSVFFSGIATLIFFVVVGGKVPSYLGSSFSFISIIIGVTGYSGIPPNNNISIALGGIIATGVLYSIVGLFIIWVGHKWIESFMPPVITGTIVAIIGLNLAPVAVRNITGSPFDVYIGISTILFVSIASAHAPGFLGRLPIILGGGLAYLFYYFIFNILALNSGIVPIDFSKVSSSDWIGVPNFTNPTFDGNAMITIAPVFLILVAENLGHIKAVGAGINRNLDEYIGRAFLGDGISTIISGSGGGTGVTTYAENIGVMGVTKNYSSLTMVVAAMFAIVFGFSPKFGALILTIPTPILGGLSFVLFGLITATAGRIWVDNKVDFTSPVNLLTAGIATVIGSGDLSVKIGSFSFGGIATATLTALILYHSLKKRDNIE
ncbi:MAG: solute carrier family 23 protein [Candidatus Methylumidiphilus sp.]